MFFGQKLKELRLKHAKMGMHNFAKKVSVDVLKLSEIERGTISPPECKEWIRNISLGLELKPNSSEDLELYNLWKEPFVMQKMRDDVAVSPLTSKTDGTQLTREELLTVNEHINSIAKKHNKKADEYNKATEHHG